MDWVRLIDKMYHPTVIAALITGLCVIIAGIIAAYFKYIRPRKLAALEKNKIPCPVNSFKAIASHSLPRRDVLRDISRKLSKQSPLVLTGLGKRRLL